MLKKIVSKTRDSKKITIDFRKSLIIKKLKIKIKKRKSCRLEETFTPS